jgi:AcrR family transcriptional regulator
VSNVGIKERREREAEKQRSLILEAAGDIVASEGIEKLSIRKIAERIEYSPAIIYHYFKDKDDIVNNLMMKGYQKIVGALRDVRVQSDDPCDMLKELTRSYISAALEMSEEFKNIQMSSSPEILEYTASLFKGAAVAKPALGILARCISEIFKNSTLDEDTIELTAQVIAVSTFGIIMKIIIEKPDKQQQERLIKHYISCTIDGMIMGKPLDSQRQSQPS